MTIHKCPHCNGEISAGSLLGKGKKTMTPKAIAARKANASKPRTRKVKVTEKG